MNEIIEPHEKLFRAVSNKPLFWKSSQGRPTSALFKDSKGVSVDRDGGRTDEAITSSFTNRFGSSNIKAVVSIEASYVQNIDALLVYTPEEDNEYHAEIHDSSTRVDLTTSKARKLAKNSEIVYLNS